MPTHDHHHDDAHEPHAPGADRIAAAEQDPATESLSQALGAGFNVLRVIMVVLLVAYCFSGYFQVEPGEQGLRAVLGRLRVNNNENSEFEGTEVFGPGFHLAWPDPFEEKIRLPAETLKLEIDTFVFQRNVEDGPDGERIVSTAPLAEQVRSAASIDPKVHGTMITGERSFLFGLWTLEYNIVGGGEFVKLIGDGPNRRAIEMEAARVLRPLAEEAIVRMAAGATLDVLIRRNEFESGDLFTNEVKRLINQSLTELAAGIEVTNVIAETVEPGAVLNESRAVTQAQSARDKLVSEAKAEAVRILNEAAGPSYAALLKLIEAYGAAQATAADNDSLQALRAEIDEALELASGQVSIRLKEAKSTAASIRERLRREYQEFEVYLDQYRRYPDLTLAQLWVRALGAVFNPKENETFVLPKSGDWIEIIVNRDVLRRFEQDFESYQEQFQRARERRSTQKIERAGRS